MKSSLYLSARAIGLVAVLVVLALAAFACGSDDDEGVSGSLERVVMSTDWLMLPQYSPVMLALDKGYYEEEGLDVRIRQGGPGLAIFEEVNRGNWDFVYGTLDDLPWAVAEGMNLKAVAAVTHGAPAVLIFRGDSGITDWEDLEGKKIGTEIGGGIHVDLLPELLRARGIDVDSIDFVQMESRARVPSLLTGEVDAITAFETTVVDVRAEEPDANFLRIRDLGTDYMAGWGLITSDRVIEERPQVVEGVVRAVLRAWVDAVENPQESLDAAARVYPEHFFDPDTALQRLMVAVGYLETPDTEEHGLGYMTDDEWNSLTKLGEQYGGLEQVLSPDSYYTNEFLPSEPVRLQ